MVEVTCAQVWVGGIGVGRGVCGKLWVNVGVGLWAYHLSWVGAQQFMALYLSEPNTALML